MLIAAVSNPLILVIPFITFALGAFTIWLYKKLDNKMTRFKRRVNIQRIGFSAQNQDWGDLNLFYDGHAVSNIHAITVEIWNDSNRDCENLHFTFALPTHCVIYKNQANYFTDGLIQEQLIENEFFKKMGDVRQQNDDFLLNNSEDALKPVRLQNDVTFVVRHRKFDIPVFNRDSKLEFTFLVENCQGGFISEADVSCNFFKKGILIVPFEEQAKREKAKKQWSEYGSLVLFLIFSYPIFLYSVNVSIAITLMIVNLFASGFLALGIFHLIEWLKKVFKY